MHNFILSKDGLGTTLDFRSLIKDLTSLKTYINNNLRSDLSNDKYKNEYLNKLIDNWYGCNFSRLENILKQIDLGLIPDFDESLNIDWLNLKNRDYNYQWRLHSFNFIPLFISCYVKTKNASYLLEMYKIIEAWEKLFVCNYYENEIFAWNDHATANRLLNLIYLYFFLLRYDDNFIGEKQLKKIVLIIFINTVVLSCRNFYTYHTNHGLFQAYNGYISTMLFDFSMFNVDLQKINLLRLKEEFRHSFTSDYVHKENSPEYHLVIFKNFLHMNEELKQLFKSSYNFIENIENFISGSLKFLSYCINPDGFLPLIGDTEQKTIDKLEYLKNYDNYSHFLFSISKGLYGDELKSIANVFPESGYFFIKTKNKYYQYNNQFYLAAKSGFLSRYHRQDDDCNFVLMAYGEDWIVDGGLYRHEHHDPIREYMRSCYSHNLLMPIQENIDIDRINPPVVDEKTKLWGGGNGMVSN